LREEKMSNRLKRPTADWVRHAVALPLEGRSRRPRTPFRYGELPITVLLERRQFDCDRHRTLLSVTRARERIRETTSRKSLGKLKTTTPVFIELLSSIEQLDLPAEGGHPLEPSDD
jgi:hypothetical protein